MVEGEPQGELKLGRGELAKLSGQLEGQNGGIYRDTEKDGRNYLIHASPQFQSNLVFIVITKSGGGQAEYMFFVNPVSGKIPEHAIGTGDKSEGLQIVQVYLATLPEVPVPPEDYEIKPLDIEPPPEPGIIQRVINRLSRLTDRH